MSVDLTALLHAASQGSPDAQDALISAVYQELRQMAGSLMRMERPGHTLQPTALVNEAYLRLFQGESKWENRAHFFGAAVRAMRRILIESARQRLALRRGGGVEKVTFADVQVQAEDPQLNLLALDEALTALQAVDPRLVRVVELRYFAGCSLEETEQILGISSATVKRDWNYARAWLYDRMSQ